MTIRKTITWNSYYKGAAYTKNVHSPPLFEIEKLFKSNRTVKILDLGCGIGDNSVFFARKGFDVYGFDIGKDAILESQKN